MTTMAVFSVAIYSGGEGMDKKAGRQASAAALMLFPHPAPFSLFIHSTSIYCINQSVQAKKPSMASSSTKYPDCSASSAHASQGPSSSAAASLFSWCQWSWRLP